MADSLNILISCSRQTGSSGHRALVCPFLHSQVSHYHHKRTKNHHHHVSRPLLLVSSCDCRCRHHHRPWTWIYGLGFIRWPDWMEASFSTGTKTNRVPNSDPLAGLDGGALFNGNEDESSTGLLFVFVARLGLASSL